MERTWCVRCCVRPPSAVRQWPLLGWDWRGPLYEYLSVQLGAGAEDQGGRGLASVSSFHCRCFPPIPANGKACPGIVRALVLISILKAAMQGSLSHRGTTPPTNWHSREVEVPIRMENWGIACLGRSYSLEITTPPSSNSELIVQCYVYLDGSMGLFNNILHQHFMLVLEHSRYGSAAFVSLSSFASSFAAIAADHRRCPSNPALNNASPRFSPSHTLFRPSPPRNHKFRRIRLRVLTV